jgi:putative ABC transport system ATP-binding protein
MSDDIIIELFEVTKIYGVGDTRVTALDHVSLKIAQGEFMAIMGPSGSGKSTMMNILGCLDRTTSGKYLLAGDDVSNLNRAQLAIIRNRRLGFIFQAYNLLSRTTALENVMLPTMYDRDDHRSAHEKRKAAMASLELVGLADRSHHVPNQLSGGQQQRVAIARALINEPALILADEPTGNLDTHSSLEIMELLANLNKQGRTIVMVTHDPDIAHYTKRIIHIRDGKIESDRMNGIRPVIAGAEASHGSD